MILVTGASGNTGRATLELLAGRGITGRAMTRHGGTMPAGIEVVRGDFDDPASLDAALAGVERAFLVTPSSERAEDQQLAFISAAARAGVRHIVKLSQLHASADSPVRFLRYHAAVEDAIRRSGLAFTFLRPNLFMQGLLQLAPMIRATGSFAAPIGDAAVSLVDVRDIAGAAVAALTGDGHTGRTYDLTGPAALTHQELAAQLSEATGRPIAFTQASDDQLRGAIRANGMPEWQVEGLIEDYAHYARGEAASVEPGVWDATGLAPRPFGAFARDYADAFAPKG